MHAEEISGGLGPPPDASPSRSPASRRYAARPATLLRAAALLVGIALIVWLDRSPSDVANQATLVMVLVTGFSVGLVARRWWLPALVVGSVIAAARCVYLALGVDLHDPHAPTTWLGVLGLLVLNVPAVLAAALGALARRPAVT